MSTVRVTYSKGPELRFLGHLDLYRLWQRTLRRAGLPLRFTDGFRPRPKLAAGPPLSLGFTSQAEVLDVTLADDTPPAHMRAALDRVLPPGLTVDHLEPVTAATPTLSSIATLSYTAMVPASEPGGVSVRALVARADALLAADALPVPRTRKGRAKTFDIRSSLRALAVRPADTGATDGRVDMTVAVTPAGTANPREVLTLLLGPEHAEVVQYAHIERRGLTFGTDSSEGIHGNHTTHTHSPTPETPDPH